MSKRGAYKVESIDRYNNHICLRDEDGRAIDWRLDKRRRGQVKAYEEKVRKFAIGDREQFTRNDRDRGRVNGLTGNLAEVDAEKRSLTMQDAREKEHESSPDQTRDRRVRHC